MWTTELWTNNKITNRKPFSSGSFYILKATCKFHVNLFTLNLRIKMYWMRAANKPIKKLINQKNISVQKKIGPKIWVQFSFHILKIYYKKMWLKTASYRQTTPTLFNKTWQQQTTTRTNKQHRKRKKTARKKQRTDKSRILDNYIVFRLDQICRCFRDYKENHFTFLYIATNLDRFVLSILVLSNLDKGNSRFYQSDAPKISRFNNNNSKKN